MAERRWGADKFQGGKNRQSSNGFHIIIIIIIIFFLVSFLPFFVFVLKKRIEKIDTREYNNLRE